jgi:regulator of protease activity HflC (stomatin/prohibitin superfamily)
MMKKYLNLTCAALLCSFLIGCDPYPFYTVRIDEEAIVTQKGTVIGASKGPGLHFKIPILQSVHKVQMYRVRDFSLPVPHSNSLQAKIIWTVKDSKKFFITKQKGNISQLVKSTVTPMFNELIGEYDLNTIALISREQHKDPEYTDDAHGSILKHIQESVDDFGIKLFNIFFEYT